MGNYLCAFHPLTRAYLNPKGYDDIVSLLLRAGAPVNCPVTEDASTPLHKACAGAKSGHLACVNALLANGADVHALNKWRETPLLTAANHGQAGAVDILLQAGADPCKCTDTGWSPLSIAAYKGHDDVVKLLLEEGAPTEEEDPTLSALLQAATKGLPDTVELLLKHGADHTVTTKKGDTALSILVEQNLIDSAVEMVTMHNASIPRCSRDRKKVQRARLLINLRMKQLENGGKHIEDALEDTSDGDDQNDESDGSQNDERGHRLGSGLQSGVSSFGKKDKRSKKLPSESAEEKARAAEEALLLELELEESKAKKERAEANSKRQKKKEKKERDRQQKLKEEQVLREKEERERAERDRKIKEKEEKERRERELNLMKQKQREQKELLEREKILAAKRKEREERQQRERQQQEREQKTRMEKEKKGEAITNTKGFDPTRSKSKQSASGTSVSEESGSRAVASASVTPNRRWEKQETISGSPTQSQQNVRSDPPDGPTINKGFASDQYIPVKSGPQHSSQVSLSGASRNTEHTHGQQQFDGNNSSHNSTSRSLDSSLQFAIEHPAISLFRRDKVSEMIARCTQVLAAVNGDLIKSVFCRWMVRASHDPAQFVDPIIPSWTDSDQVVTFFQRQLIAESRKAGSVPMSMEVLKESGASMAMYCINLGRELDQFRLQIECHLPGNWTDAELGMTVSDDSRHGEGSTTVVSWANRAQVHIPSHVFSQLNERFNGPTGRFLAAVFMAKMWYDTRNIITNNTPMGYRLSPKTKQRARVLAKISEIFSDPFSVEAGCAFWGTFEVVDRVFGGFKAFPKNPVSEICKHLGGLTLAFLPLDPPVAAKYTQHMVDTLICHESSNIPITFFVVAHSNCFYDTAARPSDLHHLDPRLLRENQGLVRLIECLPAGQHTLYSGGEAGDSKICNTPSLLFVLQNGCASALSELPDTAISDLIGTIMLPSGFQNEFSHPEAEVPPSFLRGLASNSVNRHITSHEYGAIGGATLSQPFSPHDSNGIASRRGRLFELVDNGEEEVGDDIVAGVLENLGVGLFQDNASAEVDIEAISLMGFGQMANAGLSNQVQNRFNLS